MAKNGFKIFDSDTHVDSPMEVLDQYTTQAEKDKLAGWEKFKNSKNGKTRYSKGARTYRRRLGSARPEELPPSQNPFRNWTKVLTTSRKPARNLDEDITARLADMDFEGVDVNFMLPSGWYGTWTLDEDISLEMGMHRAYHRWLDDYCAADPKRLGAAILASGRDVKGTLEEIKKWGKAKWAWGVMPFPPHGMPLDHPDLEPIWAACQEYDLCVSLHTFTGMPPYAPGGLDNWDNLFLQRSAAHSWGGMRNMASLIGSGIMDRYPKLRISTLEAGHSWLPFWLARLDEHAKTIRTALPALKHLPSEYAMNGRYFQSIEVPEGEKLTNASTELLGDHVLMYASDYPHGESHFPETVGMVMDWKDMKDDVKRKLLWDNAVKCFPRAPV